MSTIHSDLKIYTHGQLEVYTHGGLKFLSFCDSPSAESDAIAILPLIKATKAIPSAESDAIAILPLIKATKAITQVSFVEDGRVVIGDFTEDGYFVAGNFTEDGYFVFGILDESISIIISSPSAIVTAEVIIPIIIAQIILHGIISVINATGVIEAVSPIITSLKSINISVIPPPAITFIEGIVPDIILIKTLPTVITITAINIEETSATIRWSVTLPEGWVI